MRRKELVACALVSVLGVAVTAQRPASLELVERRDAEHDVPLLADALELKPGMTVADIGAGSGAMAMVMARWLGASGHVYATDIGTAQLALIREAAAKEHVSENITVVEGSDSSTNLPDACCDAIYMRDVYHHFTHPDAMNRSTLAALKSGGRFAVIDFEPTAGSKLPEGVNPNRGGHGIPPDILISEVISVGLLRSRTIPIWPIDSKPPAYFLVLFRKS